MVEMKCEFCGVTSDIDCPTCASEWECPNCKKVNKIQQVEPQAVKGGWLDENGICHFPDSVQRIPNGVYIASGFTDILELVTGIVYNKPGPGFAVYQWDVDQKEPVPPEVLDRAIGLEMDKETIDYLQKEYGGRGILIGESDGDIQDNGLTPDEWIAKYNSNGMAALAKQRFFRVLTRGGIQTNSKQGRKVTKLGRY